MLGSQHRVMLNEVKVHHLGQQNEPGIPPAHATNGTNENQSGVPPITQPKEWGKTDSKYVKFRLGRKPTGDRRKCNRDLARNRWSAKSRQRVAGGQGRRRLPRSLKTGISDKDGGRRRSPPRVVPAERADHLDRHRKIATSFTRKQGSRRPIRNWP